MIPNRIFVVLWSFLSFHKTKLNEWANRTEIFTLLVRSFLVFVCNGITCFTGQRTIIMMISYVIKAFNILPVFCATLVEKMTKMMVSAKTLFNTRVYSICSLLVSSFGLFRNVRHLLIVALRDDDHSRFSWRWLITMRFCFASLMELPVPVLFLLQGEWKRRKRGGGWKDVEND